MTTFSLTTGYAIEALACLAKRSPNSMLVREIAELTEIPLPYLSKIFQRLGDAGIVETKRGYKGGVKLTRSLCEITLLQIDAAFESTKANSQLPTGEETARPNTFWEAFHQSYREKLATMTLDEVLAYETRTQHP
ncbi:MAG: Rrf2 family transcriptional regulator [Gloeobacteraceae cyanobacterium ES-bin-144]|nr:Rrf2 family transcriptional regulator [Verrucomicrobiales bacterium]